MAILPPAAKLRENARTARQMTKRGLHGAHLPSALDTRLAARLRSGPAASGACSAAHRSLRPIAGSGIAAPVPSGRAHSADRVVGEQRRLLILSADNKLLKTGVVGENKVRDLHWAGDDHLLITISATVNMQLDFGHSYELDSVLHMGMNDKTLWAGLRQCSWHRAYVRGYFGAAEQGGQWSGYFGGITEARDAGGDFVFDHGYADLYRVDLGSGKTSLVAKGSEREHQWAIGADGTVIAHSEYNARAANGGCIRPALRQQQCADSEALADQ